MKTAVEIYKYLPKTNCGECGTGTCFGFAARLSARMASADDCPSMNAGAREALRQAAGEKRDRPGTVYEQALSVLKERVRRADFKRIAPLFGADFVEPDGLTLLFLNERYRVTKEKVLDESGREARPWISILIYNHLCVPDPPPTSGEWSTFSSVPASHAKDKAWVGHVEEVIAGHFSGNLDGLRTACERLGGRTAGMKANHDAAYEFRFFPLYPVLLVFDDEAKEEDFPAQCRILLDRNAPFYLDIESMVVLGEEFAARLTA